MGSTAKLTEAVFIGISCVTDKDEVMRRGFSLRAIPMYKASLEIYCRYRVIYIDSIYPLLSGYSDL